MNLQPMDPPSLTLTVYCAMCNAGVRGYDIRCDMDAKPGTYYCPRCVNVLERNDYTHKMRAFIRSCGYRVFIRPSKSRIDSEYCFYTDGTRIAYAQWSDLRTTVSSVHKANRTTGTGFQVSGAITADTLRDALKCHCPNWANCGDAETVRKYADWDEYHNESAFNRKLHEVTA